jgi:hypothetical protein
MTRRKLHKILSLILPYACAAGAAVVVICDVLAVSLNPEYNPLGESISDLVLFPWGWLEEIGMAAAGVAQGLIAAVILTSEAARTNRGLRLAGLMFAAISVGFSIIIVFNTDPGLAILTWGGGIHVTTVITLAVLFPLTCLLLGRALKNHPESSVIGHFSVIMGVIDLVIAWQVLPLNDVRLIGLSERLLSGVNLAWIVFAGSHLPTLVETPADPI